MFLGGFADGVNLGNAVADMAITMNLPPGVTNYEIEAIVVIAATGAFGSSHYGLYTAASAGGFSPTGGQVASTLSAATANTSGNLQKMTLTEAFLTAATLYFHVGTAQGAASTGNVYVFIRPLP